MNISDGVLENKYYNGEDKEVKVERICPVCSAKNSKLFSITGLFQFQQGLGKVEDIFKDKDPKDREFLISGICEKCLDKYQA